MEALQAFRLIRRITDFFKAYTVTPNLPTEFLQLQIKMIQSEYGADIKSMAKTSSTTDYTVYFMGRGFGSIYLMMSVSNHAI